MTDRDPSTTLAEATSPLRIVRYRSAGNPAPLAGVCSGDRVFPLSVETLAELWRLRVEELQQLLVRASVGASVPLSDVELLAPVDARTEVWACGVTYEISREARVEESEQAADVYELVYDAERPELFFKSVAWRVSGPDRPVGVREDSTVDVPEPELALVVNRHGETVGYTICNDLSSRSIEGENPLYIPQAKIFSGGCALGPWITPVWEVADPYDLGITLAIDRDGAREWEGEASTSLLHRRLDQLVSYLMRGDTHPDGAVLSTGTCLVPPAPFSLAAGDLVTITIEGLGTLANPVVRGLVESEHA